MLYQTRDHSPSAINHVEHDLPILSGLKYESHYVPRSPDRKSRARAAFGGLYYLRAQKHYKGLFGGLNSQQVSVAQRFSAWFVGHTLRVRLPIIVSFLLFFSLQKLKFFVHLQRSRRSLARAVGPL